MKKLLFSLAVLAFIGVSCNNQAPQTQNEQTEEAVDATPKPLDINHFDSLAPGLANQVVEITGTCVHTCKHGGTKMFIVGTDPDFRVKIMATDESGNFNLEMEGSDFAVIGILDEYKVDNAELDKLEADVLSGEKGEEEMKHKTHEGESAAEGQAKDEHVDHGADEQAAADKQDQLDQLKSLRERLVASGKDHLSFWSINAKSYKQINK